MRNLVPSGKTVSAGATEPRCQLCRFDCAHEVNGIGYGLLISGWQQNTDMGVRRGKKKTGGGGHTGGSRRRGKEIDMEKAVEGTDDRTMGGDDQ